MNLKNAASEFKRHMLAENRSPNSIDSYQRELRKLMQYLNQNAEVREISSDQLNRFINSDISRLRPDGKKRSLGSMSNTKAILNTFFKWLQNAGHININPSISTRIPKHKKLPVYLSDDETKALLKTIKETSGWQANRDYVACSVILHTGIRLSELIGIDVNDIDLDDNRIQIKRTKGGQPATKHINAKLKKVLRPFIDRRNTIESESPALFLSQWNRRISDRQYALRLENWAVKSGIRKKVTPHVLRHTFATQLYGRTNNILAVQKALGHAYINTTEIYTHFNDKELKESLETL